MDQTAVKDLVDEALALNESLYLIDLSISVNNKIQVVVDGDSGVPLSECIRISRNVNDHFFQEKTLLSYCHVLNHLTWSML